MGHRTVPGSPGGKKQPAKESKARSSARGGEPIKTIKPAPRRAKATSKTARAKIGSSKSKAKSARNKKVVDDLQLLTGVGPAFAKHLRKAGITSFQQIVDFGAKKKLDDLADLIDVGTDRIRRDKWIQTARREHYRKYKQRI